MDLSIGFEVGCGILELPVPKFDSRFGAIARK